MDLDNYVKSIDVYLIYSIYVSIVIKQKHIWNIESIHFEQ